MTIEYKMPAAMNTVKSRYDVAANITLFLLENGESIFGRWCGKMKAADQRALFGCFLGKGRIEVNGENDEIKHWVTVCFGTDYDTNASIFCREGTIRRDYGITPEIEELKKTF
tara:strand:+ start:726 stop:1064 length:339 start_codon:yes stop_codon:yes gene_type:complete